MDKFQKCISECTNVPDEVAHVVHEYWRGILEVNSNPYSFVFTLSNGDIVTTGHAPWGGDHSCVAPAVLTHGVEIIYSNECTFIAILRSGHVVHWGLPVSYMPAYFTQIDTVITTRHAFSIKTLDSKMHTFGKLYMKENKVDVSNMCNVRDVTATSEAFAATFADPYEGARAWGHPKYGGVIPDQTQRALKKHGVDYIVANDDAFAACLYDGSGVEVWGRVRYGGILTSLQRRCLARNRVGSIHATGSAFAVQCCNGSVLAWGNPLFGGDTTSVKSDLDCSMIEHITTSQYAFAAIVKGRRSIIVWGAVNMFGLAIQLPDHVDRQVKLYGVLRIVSTSAAFVALLGNHTVTAWGDCMCGGDITSVADDLKRSVETVYANYGAFVAKLSEGRGIVVWGDRDCGGYLEPELQTEINRIGVRSVHCTRCAFAVTLFDGSVRTWGNVIYGGDSSNFRDTLLRGYSV